MNDSSCRTDWRELNLHSERWNPPLISNKSCLPQITSTRPRTFKNTGLVSPADIMFPSWVIPRRHVTYWLMQCWFFVISLNLMRTWKASVLYSCSSPTLTLITRGTGEAGFLQIFTNWSYYSSERRSPLASLSRLASSRHFSSPDSGRS